MPRRAAGLTAVKVDKPKKPGRFGDGSGLYLLVRPDFTKFWLFRYTPSGGKLREMGLGRAGSARGEVKLADARERAAGLYAQVRAGIDPLAQREADAIEAKAVAQDKLITSITLRAAAERYIAAHEPAWKNPKHRQQWHNSLTSYVDPVCGDIPVGEIQTAHVLAVLEPIWRAKPETASRVRGRLEAILDYSKARGWRSGENPAAWKGHLALTLPARGKIAPVQHHAALPWQEIGEFVRDLRQQKGIAARALEFVIMTAGRTSEIIEATWAEIDMVAGIWTIPASRMKAGREHRVPLAEPALALLRAMAEIRISGEPGEFIFPGQLAYHPLSNMALAMVLRRMKRLDLTVHGFRSCFRDWCAESTSFPSEVAEMALAHAVGNKVEAAYRRGDLFEKRVLLMAAWADFVEQPRGKAMANVTAIRAA